MDLSTPFPSDTRVYKFPVACTSSVWALVEKAGENQDSLGGIVWDLCYMSVQAPISRPDPSTVIFKVIIGYRTHTLKAVCGPSDDMTPCISLMLEYED